jgi:hypothetical protein
MPVLLLARGDKEGRELLRKAIEARYGLGAPAIDTLKLHIEGRARTKVGPVTLWVPLESTAYFGFPSRGRFEYAVRAAGVPVRSGLSAFDTEVYLRQQKTGQPEIISEPELVRAARLRLCAAAGMLLTPLALENMEIKATGRRSFEATNLETKDTLHVTLHDDYTLDSVSTSCINPEHDNREQLLTLQSAGGQRIVDDLILPDKVNVLWDNMLEYELTPVKVEANIPLEDAFFRLDTPSHA